MGSHSGGFFFLSHLFTLVYSRDARGGGATVDSVSKRGKDKWLIRYPKVGTQCSRKVSVRDLYQHNV